MADLPTTQAPAGALPPEEERPQLALAVLFAAGEPSRTGEIAWLEGSAVLGREGDVHFVRHRPSGQQPTGPLTDPAISRRQLALVARGRQRTVERLGRQGLKVNGVPVERASLSPGDVLEVGDRLVLLVHERPATLPDPGGRLHPFGQADADGIVGEGPATWALRQRVGFVAERSPHVLVRGPSGSGKELVARALYARSARSAGPFVSRSAATIPPTLADAELFGNLRGYPNPGMPERPGLVGEAAGGVLFLDELGELPEDTQARLLRVLDSGEYTRLGEARAPHADVRVVGATNRPLDALKHDLRARLQLRIELPPLTARREELGLLIGHLLRGIARDDPALASRLVDEDGGPRITARFVAVLAAHPYTTHLRELGLLLWEAILAQPSGPLDVFDHYAELLEAPTDRPVGHVDPKQLTKEAIRAALDRNDWHRERTRRELNLSSRYALHRLMLEHDLRRPGPEDAD